MKKKGIRTFDLLVVVSLLAVSLTELSCSRKPTSEEKKVVEHSSTSFKPTKETKTGGVTLNWVIKTRWIRDDASIAIGTESGKEGLYWTLGDKITKLTKLSDLKGKVNISTEGAALQFVRLFTSPRTCLMGAKPGRVEVLSKDAVGADLVLNDPDWLKRLQKVGEWEYGIINQKTLEKEQVDPTTVVKTAVGYQIKRTLLSDPTGKDLSHCVKVVETVAKDGTYKLTKTTRVNLSVEREAK